MRAMIFIILFVVVVGLRRSGVDSDRTARASKTPADSTRRIEERASSGQQAGPPG
jgi:hypothetical protein